MNYWHSLLLLSCWLCVLTVVGREICSWLPRRTQPAARSFLAPALGLAAFILLATAAGWLFGTRTWLAITMTALLTGVALLREKNWRQLAHQLGWVLATGAVVSIGPLLTVWRYSGYNVYNDTFTYLVHAQWLQTHAFRETVIPSILQPAYTQVSLYQAAGLRMGASFFFGWVQATSPFAWSIYVYPATVSLGLTAGALAIGSLAAALVPGHSRRMVWVWVVVAGTSISGFSYGCYTGFMPQVFGLALGTTFIALLVIFRPGAAIGPYAFWVEPLALALVFAALGFAYSELLPFATLTLTGWFFLRLMKSRAKPKLLFAASGFLVWAALLLNFECVRIIKALLIQSKAVVGWPNPWIAPDYLAHALGLHAGSGDGDWWLFDPPIARSVAIAMAALIAGFVLFSCLRNSSQRTRWGAPLVFLSICGISFIIFRYFTSSPWPVGVGQSWSQFKLSNWISPMLFATGGSCLLWIGRKRFAPPLMYTLMLIWIAANIRAHVQLGPERITETLRLTGKTNGPFSVYENIRAQALAAIPKGTIFLDLGGNEYKGRQIMAYFLHDLAVAADWTGDGYIYPRLPTGWQNVSPSNSKWWVYRKEGQPDDKSVPVPLGEGVLAFAATPDFLVTRQSVTGGHGMESDASGWWQWAAEHLTVSMKVYGQFPLIARIKFTGVAVTEPRQLTVTRHLKGAAPVTETVTLMEGWQTYTSVPFRLESPDVEITIASAAKPVPIGNSDTRLVTFIAKNVCLELVGPSNQ